MFNWKKREVGEWCWLYDGFIKDLRRVKVLEVIPRERYGYPMEYYIIEASCRVDCFLLFASEAQLKDTKEG